MFSCEFLKGLKKLFPLRICSVHQLAKKYFIEYLLCAKGKNPGRGENSYKIEALRM